MSHPTYTLTGWVHGTPPAKTWILCADGGRARLFHPSEDGGSLQEFQDLINTGARLQEHESGHDRGGQVTQGHDHLHHSFQRRTSHSEHARQSFARSLCDRLAEAQQQGQLERLYIVAEPSFLGICRQYMAQPLQQRVAQEIAKDVTRQPPDVVRAMLPAHL